MTDDPKRDKDALRSYLLGGSWHSNHVSGLIDRTANTVSGAWAIPTPAIPGSFGSIIGFKPDLVVPKAQPRAHETLKRIALDTEPTDLYDNLEALALFLDSWLGPYGERKVMLSHLFDRTTTEVARLLHHDRFTCAEEIDRCIDLVNGLLEWLGLSCVHSFRPEREHHDGDFRAYCDLCGFWFDQVGYLPQAPLARCAVCEAPMERVREGRTRTTCGNTCRSRAHRTKDVA